MYTKKSIITLTVFVLVLICATIAIVQTKPQLHKTMMFEQLIFTRGK